MKNIEKYISVLLVFSLFLLCGCKETYNNNLPPQYSVGLDVVSSALQDYDIGDNLSSESSHSSAADSTPQKGNTSEFKLPSSGITSSKNQSTAESQSPIKQSFDFYGIWLTFSELDMQGLDKADVTEKLDSMMKNIANQGYTAVFCHVRPFADAFYQSDYFPFSKYLTGTEGVVPDYDALALMLAAAKKYRLEFHAWINPYRVSNSTTDPSQLSQNNIAAKWLTDGSERAVATSGGIYFNPAKQDVNKLILNGVREIIENYDVDGIHFDDYFYPTTDPSFDSTAYNQYKAKTTKPLSLADWRRANVNSLIASVYRLCNGKGVTFGISPAGDISTDYTDSNYATHYADVRLWMSNKGYVDYITPQLYFGYNYPQERYKYDRLLNIWSSLKRHSDLKIYIGLGAYKIGDSTVKDSADWCNESGSLLARQATDAKQKSANGFCVFSYTAAFSENSLNKTEIENLFNSLGD